MDPGENWALVLAKSATRELGPYPNSRTLAAIQHVELDAGLVDDPPSQPVEGINLPNHGAFADASKARIARARPEIVGSGGDEGSPRASSRSGSARLSASMSAANDDNIEGSAGKVSIASRASNQSRRFDTNLEPSATVARCRFLYTWRRRSQDGHLGRTRACMACL